MRAAYIDQHGGPEAFRYGELPDPTPAAGEVLVDIRAATVNGADWKVRNGTSLPDKTFPYVMGRDFSGVVAALGTGATDFVTGDEVYGVCDEGQEGTYATRVAINASIIGRKPANMSHIDAAALALTGLTALVSIEDNLKLKRGERILIQGGAGGVASFAIQLAKHIGATVITTASKANHPYVAALGADQVIDYQAEDFTCLVKDCDAVFDTVGGKVAPRAYDVLKPGGRAAFIASGRQPPQPADASMTCYRPKVGRGRAYIDRISELYVMGAVQPPESRTFSLAEAPAAHRISEGRHLRGKLVFVM